MERVRGGSGELPMGKQAMDVVTKQHCALGQQNWEGRILEIKGKINNWDLIKINVVEYSESPPGLSYSRRSYRCSASESSGP